MSARGQGPTSLCTGWRLCPFSKLSHVHPGLLEEKAAGYLTWLTDVETEAQRKTVSLPKVPQLVDPHREALLKIASDPRVGKDGILGLELTFSF